MVVTDAQRSTPVIHQPISDVPRSLTPLSCTWLRAIVLTGPLWIAASLTHITLFAGMRPTGMAFVYRRSQRLGTR
jgi:hypothetical protein